ncbi:MAG TPA: TetR/AcrR family transcriptional regulator [Paludibacter sp.]
MKLTKKQQIEHKAKELFWKHGFKKVTIDEICKKANVSRKTFYTFYENKTALVLFILKEMTDDAFVETRKIIDSELSFSEKLEKMLAMKFERSSDFSKEFVADFYNPDAKEMLEYFNKIIAESMALVYEFYGNAQKTGEMNPDLNLDYVMWLMQKLVELCSTKEFMEIFPDVNSMTRQISHSIIYGIMPVKQDDRANIKEPRHEM